MRVSGTALALAAVSCLVVAESDVHDLTQATFEDFVKTHDLVLAEFYAPWCGHCKALAPEYEIAATSLKEKDISLVKVDCTKESDLCKSYGVEGYPTVKVFRGPDNITPYNSERNAPAIISHMIKESLPAVSVLEKDALEAFKTQDKVVIVAYFASDDKTSNATFHDIAKAHRNDYLFGAVVDAAVAKTEGVKQPGLVLYKAFDEGKNVFSGAFEKDAIIKFAKEAATPTVGAVTPDTYSGYMEAKLPLAYIFAETQEERDELAAELKPVAEKYKGKINFATIDAKAFGAHSENLNLKNGQFPAFALQDIEGNKKYPFDQEKKINAKEIGPFVQKFADGKLEPSIKSEPIPETQDGAVKVIVANSYKQEVIDNDKDVLLEFYAPWCGHCKTLAPKYEELAAMYPEDSNVVIAKIDGTANDVPDEIKGFPTIKLFPADGKTKPLTFSGSRNIEDLAAFVKESGKYKFDAYANKTDATAKAEETAQAATDKVKSKASDVAEAVKSAIKDTDGEDGGEHDEL